MHRQLSEVQKYREAGEQVRVSDYLLFSGQDG